MFNRIIAVQPKPDHHLWLQYSDGAEGEIDFNPVIERGGVFAALSNDDTFRGVVIGDQGRYLEWPGHIDFCADALYVRLLALQGAK